MLWPSHSSVEHLREILERHLRQHSLAPSLKHHLREYLLEEWLLIVLVQFQRLVESKLRSIKLIWWLEVAWYTFWWVFL